MVKLPSSSDSSWSKKNPIVIVGAGNVGFSFTKYFLENKFNLVQLIEKDPFKIKRLDCFDIQISDDIKDLNTDASLVIVAVGDDSILDAMSQFPETNSLVVHTSGSCSIDVFEQVSSISKYGVIYPLQTFSAGQELNFHEIPIFIEGKDDAVQVELQKFVSLITSKSTTIASSQRLMLHLAAVFACNFTNHMLFCAEKILEQANLPREILAPLIQQTIDKAIVIGAANAQTGPAVREDSMILKKHLQILSSDAQMQEIYQLLSDSIIQNKIISND